jgi:hypothetical protein
MAIKHSIQVISDLFPADSKYNDTREVGESLLKQAKENTGYVDDWRSLPKKVLDEYARLCLEEHDRQYLLATRKSSLSLPF